MLHNTSVKRACRSSSGPPRRCATSVSRNNLFVGTEAGFAYDDTAPWSTATSTTTASPAAPGSIPEVERGRYPTLADVRARAPVYRHAAQLAARLFTTGLRPPADEKAVRRRPQSRPPPPRRDRRHRRRGAAARPQRRLRRPRPRPGRTSWVPAPPLWPARSSSGPAWSPGERISREIGQRHGRRPAASCRPWRPTSGHPSQHLTPHPGVVSHVKVLSDKIEDVSSMKRGDAPSSGRG